MSISIADAYYLKALNMYPWKMETVTENLNYALSYDPDHAQANCLMGRLYMEILKDFNEAEYYFEKAIMCDINYVETYKYFSLLKIWQGEYDKARKIINYGMKVKGMDKAIMTHRKVMIYEAKGQQLAAQKLLAFAMRCALSDEAYTFFKDEMSRLRSKLKAVRKYKKMLPG